MAFITKSKRLRHFFKRILNLPRQLEDLQQAVARVELRQCFPKGFDHIQDSEFTAFSQNGEDGIIQYILNSLSIYEEQFVEFGVHDYLESNTRFLLKNNNWRGLVFDGSRKNVEAIRSDPIYWRHRLTAIAAFITRENINDLIIENGVSGDIGLLSIDIDGNDYWVWEAIECVKPQIVICEYNGLFGATNTVSTPYDPSFDFRKAHYSTLYGGASIAALSHLATIKGYSLIGSNSVGNNVFFVRNDCLGKLRPVSAQEAYVPYSFRTSRDERGNLTYLDFSASVALIEDLPLVDVKTGLRTSLRALNTN